MYRAAGGGITLSTETERGVGLPGLPRPRYHAFTARSHWQTSSRSRYAKVCQVCLDRARLAAADALARVVGGCGGAALLDLHSGATGVHPAAWRLLATGQVPHAVYGRPGRQQEPPWPTGLPAVPNCSPRGTGRRKRPLAAPEGMRCPRGRLRRADRLPGRLRERCRGPRDTPARRASVRQHGPRIGQLGPQNRQLGPQNRPLGARWRDSGPEWRERPSQLP